MAPPPWALGLGAFPTAVRYCGLAALSPGDPGRTGAPESSTAKEVFFLHPGHKSEHRNITWHLSLLFILLLLEGLSFFFFCNAQQQLPSNDTKIFTYCFLNRLLQKLDYQIDAELGLNTFAFISRIEALVGLPRAQ